MDKKSAFNNIYLNNIWKDKSGPGSDPNNAKEWIHLVNNFIKENGIKSVLDLGCGDWRIGRELYLKDIKYTGVDISDVVLNETQMFQSENINFICHDIETFEYPMVDLILIKDVIQHLPTASTKNIIDKITKSSKYALVCNDFEHKNHPINANISPGEYTNIDLHKDPFNYNFKNILDYYVSSLSITKRVYLFENYS